MKTEDILGTQDILPLGTFETIPITCLKKSGKADDYPHVVVIKDRIDHLSLLTEAHIHIQKIGTDYIKERAAFLDPRISKDQMILILAELGFIKGKYQSFSLRKIGTNQLEDYIGPCTRNFFKDIHVQTFRQQYALAQNGWKTKLHRDHYDFKTHGFRAMVPLDAPAFMGYVGTNNENLIYQLDPGRVYFVNIAQFHRAFVHGSSRLNLMFQMATDDAIFAPESFPLTPLESLETIPEELRTYEMMVYSDESPTNSEASTEIS